MAAPERVNGNKYIFNSFGQIISGCVAVLYVFIAIWYRESANTNTLSKNSAA
jgi:hypothetical protein